MSEKRAVLFVRRMATNEVKSCVPAELLLDDWRAR